MEGHKAGRLLAVLRLGECSDPRRGRTVLAESRPECRGTCWIWAAALPDRPSSRASRVPLFGVVDRRMLVFSRSDDQDRLHRGCLAQADIRICRSTRREPKSRSQSAMASRWLCPLRDSAVAPSRTRSGDHALRDSSSAASRRHVWLELFADLSVGVPKRAASRMARPRVAGRTSRWWRPFVRIVPGAARFRTQVHRTRGLRCASLLLAQRFAHSRVPQMTGGSSARVEKSPRSLALLAAGGCTRRCGIIRA